MQMAIAGGLFIVSYILIATEKVDKTVVAIIGGTLLIILGVLDQETAFEHVDFNVIFLLAGMMIIAGITRKTGVFQWIAIKAARLSGGNPYRALVFLSLVTAILSAFLDNVTTVVLIAPVTLSIAPILGVSPIPLLIAEIMASNIGGTATLIGDPPNIIIASAADIDFVTFAINMTPPVMVAMVAFLATARFMFGDELRHRPGVSGETFLMLAEEDAITHHSLLRKSLLVLALTILGFLFHAPLGVEPATIALLGAGTLMLISGEDPHEALNEVEWPTIFFFLGLFILVGGLIETGIIDSLSQGVLRATGGNDALTVLALLWISAPASAIVDNIPYTAAMVPLVQQVGGQVDSEPLWWALALGADLGGNATVVGASANVLVVHIAKRHGYPITFGSYLKYGLIITSESMIIATVYLWLRYLM